MPTARNSSKHKHGARSDSATKTRNGTPKRRTSSHHSSSKQTATSLAKLRGTDITFHSMLFAESRSFRKPNNDSALDYTFVVTGVSRDQFLNSRPVVLDGAESVYRAQSTLKGAGMGLFAKYDMAKGTILEFKYIDDDKRRMHGRVNINDLSFDLAKLKRIDHHLSKSTKILFKTWLQVKRNYLAKLAKKTNLIQITFVDRNGEDDTYFDILPNPNYDGGRSGGEAEYVRVRKDQISGNNSSSSNFYSCYEVTRNIKAGTELSVCYTVSVWARLLSMNVQVTPLNALQFVEIFDDAQREPSSVEMKREMQILEDAARDIESL